MLLCNVFVFFLDEFIFGLDLVVIDEFNVLVLELVVGGVIIFMVIYDVYGVC